MIRSLVLGAVCLLASSASVHAQLQPKPFDLSLADRALLERELSQAKVDVQRLVVPEKVGLLAEVPVVIDGESVTLSVRPYDIRSPEYKLLVQGPDGVLREHASGTPTTVRGTVLEWPGSRVAGSLVNGELEVLVAPGPGMPVYAVQSARQMLPELPTDAHAVYSSMDTVAGDWKCGSDHLVQEEVGHDHAPAPAGGYAGIFDLQICEIACDADFEYYQLNGSSVSNTEADILNIINRTEDIYEVQPEILYEVTTIIVRTSEPDPYNTTNASGLLGQFRSEWTLNQTGIQRDVAHFFTGKNIAGSTIGIASLGVICSQVNGYGLSQSRFSFNIISRTGLTAHELGHNWSAGHCNGQSDCSIMCSGLGGCTGILTSFGDGPLAQIINHKNSRGCLEDAVPPPVPSITGVNPSDVEVLDGGTITLFGEGFKSIENVRVNGSPVDLDTVEVISFNELQVSAPLSNSLGSSSISVENVTGTSPNANFNYVPVSTPRYFAPAIIGAVFGPPPPGIWDYASTPGDVMFLFVDLDEDVFFASGIPVLNTPFKPFLRTLNAAGVGQLVVPASAINLPPGTPALTVYTQGVFFGPFLKDSSAVEFTVVF